MGNFVLSVSSIKTFCASKARWWGKYILWIKEDTDFGDSLSIGRLFENWLFTWEDKYDICENVKSMENIVEAYDALKWNAQWLQFKKGKWNKEVKWMLFWYPVIWYIDNYNETSLDDIKTCTYLSKKESNQINHWSGMTYYQEYELQLRVYHMLTGVNKCRILEVSKHKYVTAKDKDRHENQVIEFNFDEEYDKEMTEKFEPIVKEMLSLYNQFNK